MAKSRSKAPSILTVSKDISAGKILPVYYLFGEDTFSLDKTIRDLEKSIQPFITSDFDKEIIYAEDKNLLDILSVASSFPFGSEKKFILVKEFEKVSSKKNLINYIKSPADFTHLVIVHNGSITNLTSEPFKTLLENNFIYEAVELKGNNLIEWIIQYVCENNKEISRETASVFADMVGENRNLIETQLEKVFIYLGDKKEIDIESIESLSAKFKEYTIFDLQDALGAKNRRTSFKVAFNLLEKGSEPVFIIHMLTKFFTGILRINELKSSNTPESQIARIVGTHPFYLKKFYNARRLYSDMELINISRALLNADISIKTTSTDNKTIITVLLTEIFNAGAKNSSA
jgi:DNA polymerase III subunit delta